MGISCLMLLDRVISSLVQEENEDRPRVATLVSSLANYSATAPAPSATGDPDGGDKPKSSPKLGTLAGVYFPCMQNIFGIILFIRLTWVIGTAGIVQAFFLVTMCCTCVSSLLQTFFFCRYLLFFQGFCVCLAFLVNNDRCSFPWLGQRPNGDNPKGMTWNEPRKRVATSL